jgi:hypothetical protein
MNALPIKCLATAWRNNHQAALDAQVKIPPCSLLTPRDSAENGKKVKEL